MMSRVSKLMYLFGSGKATCLNVLLVLPVVCALASCTFTAGRDFVRPSPGSLVIGETTTSEVLARYGTPQSTGSETRGGQRIDNIFYSYASNEKAVVNGATPARVLLFSFLNGRLVGYEFISSYPKDHTRFDPSKRSNIHIGSSTREDVINLMGAPNGELSGPLVDPPAEYALVYSYYHTQVSVGFMDMRMHQRRMQLLVLLGAGGIVQDVKYSESET